MFKSILKSIKARFCNGYAKGGYASSDESKPKLCDFVVIDEFRSIADTEWADLNDRLTNRNNRIHSVTVVVGDNPTGSTMWGKSIAEQALDPSYGMTLSEQLEATTNQLRTNEHRALKAAEYAYKQHLAETDGASDTFLTVQTIVEAYTDYRNATNEQKE
jgi:hypothetical protein